MSEEKEPKDVIRPYVVDGIEEYDNPMPPWWVAMFKLTVIFGVGYMIWVHWFGWSQLEDELKAEQLRYGKQMSQLASQSGASAEGFADRARDPQLIASGKELFQTNCAACHGAAGEGVVGPNLTDRFWLHGGQPLDVVNVITKGVPEKGMVAWGSILGPSKIEAVAAFVLSLADSNPPNAKAPEGEELKP